MLKSLLPKLTMKIMSPHWAFQPGFVGIFADISGLSQKPVGQLSPLHKEVTVNEDAMTRNRK